MARPKGSWINETKSCEYCEAIFGPSDLQAKAVWINRRFCSKTCAGKVAPRAKVIPIEIRFWSYVDKTPGHGTWGDCWDWTGAKAHYGHGMLSKTQSKRKIYAHRYSYQLHKGDLSDLDVRHTCDNPSCDNPDHLILGTHAEHMADMKSRKRQPWGEAARDSKLTEVQVRSIRKDSRVRRIIAAEYGVSITTITLIKHRKKWQHLPD